MKAADRAPRKFKGMTRAEKIEQAMKVYKWWEEPVHEDGRQWESLEHNGAHFAPEYQPHGVKLKYDGEDVTLTPLQEEVATFYASVSFPPARVHVRVPVPCGFVHRRRSVVERNPRGRFRTTAGGTAPAEGIFFRGSGPRAVDDSPGWHTCQ